MNDTPKSDTAPDTPENGAANKGQTTQEQPSLRILGQYLKDMSFENPNAPQSLSQDAQPEISISVNVNARPLAETDFEVELHLEAKAMAQDKVAFAAELVYAGMFRLENFPQQLLHPAILIECPRLLFPFVRRIISDVTRDGGFPALNVDTVDFVTMYRQELARRAQAQQNATVN